MPARVTNAQVMEALLGLATRLDAVESAPARTKDAPAKGESTEPKVPYLSCWTASRITRAKDGTFSHKAKKPGATARKYRALTRDEAIALLDENLAAGRVFAVPA